jgi:hypothetical protein
MIEATTGAPTLGHPPTLPASAHISTETVNNSEIVWINRLRCAEAAG